MRKDPSQVLLRIRRLRRSELPADTLELARYLIGKTLVHDLPKGRMSGRIVETEAYPVGDAAGHAFRGETPSIRSLFLRRGHAYVYFTYGSCFMMNVSSEKSGIGAGVLLRALEPLEGIRFMERRRRTHRLLDLARGPGRLAQAMDIDKRVDGVDLCAVAQLFWLVRSHPARRANRPQRANRHHARGTPTPPFLRAEQSIYKRAEAPLGNLIHPRTVKEFFWLSFKGFEVQGTVIRAVEMPERIHHLGQGECETCHYDPSVVIPMRANQPDSIIPGGIQRISRN